MAQETGQAPGSAAICSLLRFSADHAKTQHLGQQPKKPHFHAPIILCIFLLTASYFCPALWPTQGNTKLHSSLCILQVQKMGVPMKSGLSLTFTIRLAYNDPLPASFPRKWNWPFHLVCLQRTVWMWGLRKFQLNKSTVKHRAELPANSASLGNARVRASIPNLTTNFKLSVLIWGEVGRLKEDIGIILDITVHLLHFL